MQIIDQWQDNGRQTRLCYDASLERFSVQQKSGRAWVEIYLHAGHEIVCRRLKAVKAGEEE
jgi:hypothetical protein